MPRQSVAFLILSVVAPLATYLATAAPGLTLVDSGELALACGTLGIAHSPGFPLYVLLGHWWSLLPLGPSVARRMNLFSAFSAALAAGVTFLLCRQLLLVAESGRAKAAGRRQKKKLEADPPLPADLAALAAALVFGFSLSLWSWAVVTEVYALNILLLALLLWFAARGEWRGAALAAGLGLGVHHATVALALPAAVYLLWTTAPPARRQWPAIAALFAAGLLVYLYLPIRAAQSPLLNWGDPQTLERFWWQVTAKQYRVHLFEASAQELALRAAYFFKLWVKQFTPVGFFLAGAGLLALVRGRRRLFWFTAILMALDVGFSLNYDIGEDIEGYYLPAFLAWAWCFAAGAQALLVTGARAGGRWRKAVAAAVVVAALLPAASNFSSNNRRRDRIAERYVENTLRGVEPGALILTSDWQFYSPWLYRHYREHFRPNVAVVDTLLLRRSWYVDFVERQYPDLARATATELAAYRRQLDLFEHDRPYQPAEIEGAFVTLVGKMVRARQAAGAAVYFTWKMEWAMLGNLPLVPQGVLYRLGTEAPEVTLDLGGLSDGTAPLDSVEREVRRIYVVMLTARAEYLRPRNAAGAREKAELALSLESGYAPARRLLAAMRP